MFRRKAFLFYSNVDEMDLAEAECNVRDLVAEYSQTHRDTQKEDGGLEE